MTLIIFPVTNGKLFNASTYYHQEKAMAHALAYGLFSILNILEFYMIEVKKNHTGDDTGLLSMTVMNESSSGFESQTQKEVE